MRHVPRIRTTALMLSGPADCIRFLTVLATLVGLHIGSLGASAAEVLLDGSPDTPSAGAEIAPDGLEDEGLSGNRVPDEAVENITVYGDDQSLASFNANEANTATRLAIPIRQTPISIQVVPQSVIASQAATELSQAVRNVSGVQDDTAGNSSQGNNTFAIRGFPTRTTFLNGTPSSASSTTDTSNIERVEVLKGPASVLYGLVEPGGIVNIITRTPRRKTLAALEQQFASNGYYRTAVDINTPLTEGVAIRLTGAAVNAGSFRNFGESERYAIAPSLLWKPGEDTELVLEGGYNQTRRRPDSGVAFDLQGDPVAPIDTFLGNPFLPQGKASDWYGRYQLSHAFSESVEFRSIFDARGYNADLQQVFSVLVIPPAPGEDVDQVFQRRSDNQQDFASYQFVNDVGMEFQLGPSRHNVLVGLDLRRLDRRNASQQARAVLTQRIVDPVYTDIDLPLDVLYEQRIAQKWLGLYLQDAISLFSGEWLHLLLGGRYDVVTTDLQTARRRSENLTGRVGALADVTSWLGVYGSVSQSFNPVNATAFTRTGTPIDAETGLQYEVGFKAELPAGGLLGVALYDLTKDNVAVADPVDPTFSINGGKQRARGIEFDITGELVEGLNVIASYAYTNTTVLRSDRLPEGEPLRNIPPHAGSLWISYAFPEMALEGLRLAAGLFASSQRSGDDENSFQLPRYTTAAFAVSYSREIREGVRAELQLNLNNALDQRFYTRSTSLASITPGAPRAFMCKIGLRY